MLQKTKVLTKRANKALPVLAAIFFASNLNFALLSAPVAQAASCSNASDCGSGQICDYSSGSPTCAKCQSNSDCTNATEGYGANYTCNGSGACISSASNGGYPLNSHCSYNSDCASNYCDIESGTCQPASGGAIATGAAGSICNVNVSNSCNAGLTCSGGTCVPASAGSTNAAQYPIGQPKNGGSCGTTDTNIIKQIQTSVGVSPTGTCDSGTITAIQVFQQNNGLTDDGIVGANTLAVMGISSGTNQGGLAPGGAPPSSPLAPGGAPPASDKIGANCTGDTTPLNGICVPNNPFKTGIAASGDITTLVTNLLKWLLFLAGIVAVVMIVIGGFWYMTAGGNEEQSEKGRKYLINAVIGLVVVILAYAIVTIITNLVTASPGTTTGTNTTTSTAQHPGVNSDGSPIQ